MMEESDELENTSLAEFRQAVVHQAEFFMETELDPDGQAELPNSLRMAISECVLNCTTVEFNCKWNVL